MALPSRHFDLDHERPEYPPQPADDNPDANAWTGAASMATGRGAAAATLLGDGSVLLIGGANSTAGELAGVERDSP